MAKSILGESPVLPDIDKQIDYVKKIRREVIPNIRNLQSELQMIFAIEQSLMAAKVWLKSESRTSQHTFQVNRNSTLDFQCNQILGSRKIKLTSIRIETLKAILEKEGNFTISEIYKALSKTRLISKTAVITTIKLFKVRGLIIEIKDANHNTRVGRPEIKFIYRKSNRVI
jgi:predicted transcriptional regulator